THSRHCGRQGRLPIHRTGFQGVLRVLRDHPDAGRYTLRLRVRTALNSNEGDMLSYLPASRLTRAIFVSLCLLASVSLGCSDAAPTRPTDTFVVTSVS